MHHVTYPPWMSFSNYTYQLSLLLMDSLVSSILSFGIWSVQPIASNLLRVHVSITSGRALYVTQILTNMQTTNIICYNDRWYNAYTDKTKTLPQSGDSVLYWVCVWRRSLTSSRTQYGSLLPPMSADFRSSALNTVSHRLHAVMLGHMSLVTAEMSSSGYLQRIID